ncbi:C2 domain [Trypanosoma melophagium]|uniref:C2 domain n=1 Tax=Trypanosoma melophagium TaxID=715481 RepID=UPI00351A30D8|nr:C2 domain [Trypanosoma melophagium]
MNSRNTFLQSRSGSPPQSHRSSTRRSQNSRHLRPEHGNTAGRNRSSQQRHHYHHGSPPSSYNARSFYEDVYSSNKDNYPPQYNNRSQSRRYNSGNNGYQSTQPFQYNDTLPPYAVGYARRPDPMSEDEDYFTPGGKPLSVPRSETGGKRKKKVRVRIEGIRNLLPLSRATQHPPSTFVTVQTSYGRGKTPIIHNNANPPFNDEFVFEVTHPETEEITVTVVAVTSSTRKKLGQCVFSVKNIVRGKERRQWVSLVRHPGSERAYDCGYVLISLYTDTFGLRNIPPSTAEGDFRERLRVLLRMNAPEELHRLEWYVGECMDDYDGAFSALCKKFHKPGSDPAPFEITVKSVANLVDRNASPVVYETCYVVVIAGRHKKVTKMVPYCRLAKINETFKMTLVNPKADNISLAVYSAKHKIGECLISLNGLQRAVPKERTHSIVCAAGTGDACYSGNITIVLYSPTYGSDQPVNERSEEMKRIRVRNYLWRYLRDDLHRLDPIVASIDDIDTFMSNWVRECGPEPHRSLIKLGIQRFHLDKREDTPRIYGVITRIGPEFCRSSAARYAQDFIFNNNFDISVCGSENEELLFIIVEERDSNDTEIGRVAMSLKNVKRGDVFKRSLQVYKDALTANAKPVGILSIEGVSLEIGLIEEPALKKEQCFRQRVEALFNRYDPSQLHRVEYLLGENIGSEERLIKQLTDTYGPETGTAPMRIRILSIRDFLPMCSCYVKVYLDDVPVLRTKDHYAARSLLFDIGMKNEATVSLENPLHSMLKFKIAEHRKFRAPRVLGMAEMSLRNMVREEPNVCWLPIIDVNSNEEIGVLGVELQSHGFAKGTVVIYDNPRNGSGGDVLDEVTRDVTSLVKKYAPQELAHIQPLIAESTSLREAHKELRRKFATKPVQFTFYIHIDNVNMTQTEEKNAFDKGLISVGAIFAEEQMRTSMKTEWAGKIDTRKFFPEIRMDIGFLKDTESVANAPMLEILLHEKPMQQNGVTTSNAVRRSVHGIMSTLSQEKELGRVALSLRALLTKRTYQLGEAITVPIIRTSGKSISASRSNFGVISTDVNAIVGEVTLRITTPAFEEIPRRLQFTHASMKRFHRSYVRYYEKRISSFYRAYDPWSLRDFHFTLYERDVASAKWPLSLYDWLVALIKRYGPEPSTAFGPPPKLPFDPEEEEADRLEREVANNTVFSSTEEGGSEMASTAQSQSRRKRKEGGSTRD